MFFLLMGLLGAGAVGAAAGGGSSSGSDRESESTERTDVVALPEGEVENIFVDTETIVDASEKVTDPPVEDDDMAHDDRGDMGHDDDDDMAHDDHGDMGHDDDDDMAHDDHGDMGHDDDDDMAHDDHGDHSGHGDHGEHSGGAIPLPTTAAEIDAFVAAVRAAPETHSHDHGSAKAGEHMAAMDLVPRAEATHIAIANGDWDDPSNWHNGEVPGDDAKVLIPDGVHMFYDHMSDARLFTLRLDGKLEFATDVDTQMVVDTIVTTPGSYLQIGTAANPVHADVTADIIFANNGAIDTDWDPMLLSRGMVAHGEVEIHGTEKDSHDKVVDDPMAGDTWIDMGTTPQGWAVGDTIVIAGTHYEGYTNIWTGDGGYIPPQDEVRTITEINDGMIFFDDPLIFDHDTPRADLKTSVANYTRNVSFETEDADLAEINERGHVMFMHNNDVDVRYAEFQELGRTDKSETALNASEFLNIDFDSNVKGRYSFHFHRAGLEEQDDPAIAIGNSVYGSPGWGFVHHESHAILENNATYDTFGAAYVAENGTETGEWNDNIAIFAQGVNWRDPKLGNDLGNFDMGKTGDGFWFQGRMVTSVDNVAASVNNGFVYFHRGTPGPDEQTTIDSAVTDIPGAFHYSDRIAIEDHPILGFSGNEAFATKSGMYVAKSNISQGHDVHTVLEDFTAWNVQLGADLSYTAHYTLSGFDLVAEENTPGWNGNGFGIMFGTNTSDMAIVDATIEGFENGIRLDHVFTIPTISPEENEFKIVNPTFTNVVTEIDGFNPELDTLLNSEDIPYQTPDIKLDGPLTYKEGWGDPGARVVEISGTKTDSLGVTDFPTGWDNYDARLKAMVNVLEENGYYTTTDGQDYTMMDFFFSDRLTGDIYMERHPVFLDENVNPGEPFTSYSGATFNGIQDLGGEDDPTIDSAILWATLTEGQVELSDEAIALQEEEEEREAALEEAGWDML